MRLPILVGLFAIALVMHGGIARAGDGPTLEARPLTAAEIAEQFLSTDPAARAAGEKAVAEAPPAVLREILAAIRERVEKPAPATEVIEAPKAGGLPDQPCAEPPDLPDPVAAPEAALLINLDVQFIEATPEAARALFGSEAGAGKLLARPPTAEEIVRILDGAEKDDGEFAKVSGTHLTVFDRQRATVQILNKVSYIADVEVGCDSSGAAIADPIVKTVAEGLVLDLRPTLSADRKSMRLEFSTKDARVVRPIEEEDLPIAGQANPVKVQRPEVTTAGWSKTLSVPDGGRLLAGGWPSIGAEGKPHVRLVLLHATVLETTGIEAITPHVAPTLITPEASTDEPKPDPKESPR